MKIKINYTINNFQDSYILEGINIKDILEQNKNEMEKRGLDAEKNEMYSEEL